MKILDQKNLLDQINFQNLNLMILGMVSNKISFTIFGASVFKSTNLITKFFNRCWFTFQIMLLILKTYVLQKLLISFE